MILVKVIPFENAGKRRYKVIDFLSAQTINDCEGWGFSNIEKAVNFIKNQKQMILVGVNPGIHQDALF